MRIFYISPSTIPSRTANAVHVVNMANALGSLGSVKLFFACPVHSVHDIENVLANGYGLRPGAISISPLVFKTARGLNLRIALFSLISLALSFISGSAPRWIYSRNLYASLIISKLIPSRLIFETHQIETGLRGRMQQSILTNQRVTSVVISDALRQILSKALSLDISQIVVEHDAINKELLFNLSTEERTSIRANLGLVDNQIAVGYFGHIYPGRGIETILGLSRKFPGVKFVVVGGNETEIQNLRSSTNSDNVTIVGYLPHAKTIRWMKAMDILLMPYQEVVAIDAAGLKDTSRYMSPMKMFEYMGSRVPLISSDLPVLREVLADGVNCLLSNPSDVDSWTKNLTQLIHDKELRIRLADSAYREVESSHTWQLRAQRIVQAATMRSKK